MEWSMISVKYPEAWKLLIDFHDSDENVGLIDHPTVWAWEGTDISAWELRHLYDFFDGENIYCQCMPKQALDDSVWFIGYIWSDVYEVNEYVEEEYNSRSELEYRAFLKAFEILEEKLNH